LALLTAPPTAWPASLAVSSTVCRAVSIRPDPFDDALLRLDGALLRLREREVLAAVLRDFGAGDLLALPVEPRERGLGFWRAFAFVF
jgi:hypothetical protein